MATAKTATLAFHIEPGLKEALRAAAEREHRSVANVVEVLIRDYLRAQRYSRSGTANTDYRQQRRRISPCRNCTSRAKNMSITTTSPSLTGRSCRMPTSPLAMNLGI